MDAVPGIGVDLIEIDRLERAIERRPGLAERIFSEGELEYSRGQARPARHLAARFAAKEAALKALGIGGLRLHEVEVVGGAGSAPSLVLHGDAEAVAEREDLALSVSLTHSRELAAAVVRADPR